MSIEEANEILNEAIITEPSVKSQIFIEAEQINIAIERVLEELTIKDQKIKDIEEKRKIEKRNYEEKIERKERIICEMVSHINNYTHSPFFKNNKTIILQQ